MAGLARALEQTWIAAVIGGSSMTIGVLSAIHLLGFTLVMGSATLADLRLAGLLLTDRDTRDITRPTSRAIAIGLSLSVLTGVLLFAPRATGALENWLFQLKMGLLLAATAFHGVVIRAARHSSGAFTQRAAGVLGLALWLSLAAAACAFLLIE